MTWAEFCAQLLPVPHTITGEPYTGSGAYGDVFGAPVTITPCVVDDTRRRVRAQTQDAAGTEVLSSTTVFCPSATSQPPGSRITLPSGRVTRVLAVSVLDAMGWDLPDHIELNLE